MDKKAQLNRIYSTLEPLVGFLNSAHTFINSHFVDFFTQTHFETILPSQLQSDLQTTTLESFKGLLSQLVAGEIEPHPLPHLQFNQESDPSLSQLFSRIAFFLTQIQSLQSSFSNGQMCHLQSKWPNNIQGQELLLSNVELSHDKFMSPKKVHEVERMGDLIDKIRDNQHNLIDLGSGKGYISSYMNLFYNLNVLAIDSSSINSRGCEKRSEKLTKRWSALLSSELAKRSKNGSNSKEIPTSQSPELINLTLFVQFQEFEAEETLRNCFPGPNSSLEHGLIGLHTCGQLGVDSLRVFVNSSSTKFLVNVPCCFHLLQEEFDFEEPLRDESISSGFPMSSILRAHEFSLGINARNMCAHSIEKMLNNVEGLKLEDPLFYRTILQVLLTNRLGSSSNGLQIGRSKRRAPCFNEYVREALKKLNIETDLKVSDEEIATLYVKYEPHRIKLHLYFLLKTVLGSLVEHCILLDRLAFLLEQDCIKGAHITQIFDPSISPRCHAIVALK